MHFYISEIQYKSSLDLPKIQIKSEQITLLAEYFQSWSNLMFFCPT